jgi:pyridoxamine 5'-phosphate oxidase
MRREYHLRELVESAVTDDPLRQFRAWFDDATASATLEPNAMVLATVDAASRPSQRTVLLKQIDEAGFVFFTNYQSRKGREIAENPQVALLFFWPNLERQVRISGVARHLDAPASDGYFAERPRGSQIGAMASPQSQVVPDRQWLAERFESVTADLGDESVAQRPDHWGGVIVTPDEYEFWQGRPNRLHDRLRYRLDDDGVWVIERLAP